MIIKRIYANDKQFDDIVDGYLNKEVKKSNTIQVSMNKEENTDNIQKITNSSKKKKRIIPPYGYIKEEGKIILRNDNTKEIVAEIFRMYIENTGMNQIARILTQRKIPTPAKIKNQENASEIWHNSTVKNILTNSLYTGFNLSLNNINNIAELNLYLQSEAVCEKIISISDFIKIQKIIQKKRKKSVNIKKKHLFSKLVYCNDCKKNLRFYEDRNSYICSSYVDLGKAFCTSHQVNEEYLTEIIRADLNEIKNLTKSDQIDIFQDIDNELIRYFIDKMFVLKNFDIIIKYKFNNPKYTIFYKLKIMIALLFNFNK